MSLRFGPEQLLDCYRRGVFPMADSRHDANLFLIDPPMRGLIELDAFHVPSRLARTVRQDRFLVRIDTAFTETVIRCADAPRGRDGTWINDAIINLYSSLHRAGHAHSVECWRDDRLVGGLYGVSLGAAFFGESMFSEQTDASKVALVHLVARLTLGGYRLLDCQFVNAHLLQFGIIETPRETFRKRLAKAVAAPASFYSAPVSMTGAEALQAITQTS